MDVANRSAFNRGLRGLPSNNQGSPIKQANPIHYITIPPGAPDVATGPQNWPQASREQEFNTPVIIVGSAENAADFSPSVKEMIYALPTELRDPANGFYANNVCIPGIQSVNGGTLYLPAGKYYLYYAGAEELRALVIDASDPLLAAQYLMRPGNHTHTIPNAASPDDINIPTGSATTFAPGNYRRKAVWFQNVGSTPIRVTIGSSVALNRGFYLPVNQFPPMVLAGPTLSTDDLIATPLGGVDGTMACIEIV